MQTSKSSNVNRRVFKYFLIVFFFGVIINSPRFLESKIVTESIWTNYSGSAEVFTRVTYDITDLRRNPDYVRYDTIHIIFQVTWTLCFNNILVGLNCPKKPISPPFI